MSHVKSIALLLSTAVLGLSSCGGHANVDSKSLSANDLGQAERSGPFLVSEKATFNEPWAAAFEPETGRLFITEKAGTIKFYDANSGATGSVSGVPTVDYGGQGGLGDIAFAPDYPASHALYLSWVEAGPGDIRGAVIGRGQLVCSTPYSCAIKGLKIIWRQAPKVTGRGHFSHRIAFSPDGKFMFISSGERQKGTPAQDLSNNLGSTLRLTLDGQPAPDNPFADKGGLSQQIWSYGHRNLLGLAFDTRGRLWGLEHGPKGGDELNLIRPGSNYGWPIVSDGDQYNGTPIPRHATRPDFAAPAISWNPVIAPGDMIFYKGDLFRGWQGNALIAGMGTEGLVRVAIDGDTASEAGRYGLGARIREVIEAPDGALWTLDDGENARLLRLTPASS